jgi:histidyl-tRNA synthetase
MAKVIEPLRGVHDVLPTQIAAWQHLERVTREVFAGYGYEEFRVPIIEQTQLFKRSIGDFTDIVEKEMFSFVDQGDDHITLRPEATAGIVRAVISNGLLRDNRLRVWCMGPMFRRELSPVSSDRCGGVRLSRARHRCGNDSIVRAAITPARLDPLEIAAELAGHAGIARGLSGPAHGLFQRARSGPRRGQSTALARQSAAHPR